MNEAEGKKQWQMKWEIKQREGICTIYKEKDKNN